MENIDIKYLKEYWQGDGFKNIKPQVGGEFPEGFDPRPFLHKIHMSIRRGLITEMGCGCGRLANAFPVDSYTGVDINPLAVKKAQENYPAYRFKEINTAEEIEGGNLLMAYTVFLHMPDDLLRNWLDVLKEKFNYVLIAEILGRNWRRDGNPPVFCRDIYDYKKIMEPWQLSLKVDVPYKRYIGSQFVREDPTRSTEISFMVFSKELDYGLLKRLQSE